MPYYLQGSVNTSNVSTLISAIYTNSNKPGVSLLNMTAANADLSAYVLSLRKSNTTAFLYDYYLGLSLNLVNITNLQITDYYSTLVYHSAGVILNEMNNILLKYYTNNVAYTLTTINSPLSAASSLTSDSTDFVKVLACIDILPMSLIDFSRGNTH